MMGILLFIVLPVLVLIVGAVIIAVLVGGSRGPDDQRRPSVTNNFIDWMM